MFNVSVILFSLVDLSIFLLVIPILLNFLKRRLISSTEATILDIVSLMSICGIAACVIMLATGQVNLNDVPTFIWTILWLTSFTASFFISIILIITSTVLAMSNKFSQKKKVIGKKIKTKNEPKNHK